MRYVVTARQLRREHAVSLPSKVVLEHSCGFCGKPVDMEAADAVILMVRTPSNRVASLNAHAACLAAALHFNSRSLIDVPSAPPPPLDGT